MSAETVRRLTDVFGTCRDVPLTYVQRIYESLLKRAEIPAEVSQSKTVTGGAKLQIHLSGEAKLPFAKAGGAATGETSRDVSQLVESRSFEIDPEDANDVVDALRAEAVFDSLARSLEEEKAVQEAQQIAD